MDQDNNDMPASDEKVTTDDQSVDEKTSDGIDASGEATTQETPAGEPVEGAESVEEDNEETDKADINEDEDKDDKETEVVE